MTHMNGNVTISGMKCTFCADSQIYWLAIRGQVNVVCLLSKLQQLIERQLSEESMSGGYCKMTAHFICYLLLPVH